VHACDTVRSLWPGPAPSAVLTEHLFYKALRGAHRRLKQHDSRDTLFAALSGHASAADLLEHALGEGLCVPEPHGQSVLHFLKQNGFWSNGSDGKLLECGLKHGIDCSVNAKSDSAPFAKGVLHAKVWLVIQLPDDSECLVSLHALMLQCPHASVPDNSGNCRLTTTAGPCR
jgi:hypothetical protein